MATQRVETTLLVVEPFKDESGFEHQAGDRVSLARAAVRRAALERPELFMVEYATEELDPDADWFQAIVADYERRYQELKSPPGRRSRTARGGPARRVESAGSSAAGTRAPLRKAGERTRGTGQADP
jgi:hypothetical protein